MVSNLFGGVAARGSITRASLRVEAGHRERDLHQIAPRHAGENVDVAGDQRRLGDDADRMSGALQHFENAAHHLVAPLDRLIGIGVGADRDHARRIARRGEFALQQFRRVGLHEQLGFEIEPGREPHVGVRRPREAVDAAVLAAAVRVDRAVEADVGRVVAGDDLARGLDRDGRLEGGQLLDRLPAVIEGDARGRLVAARRIRQRSPAAPSFTVDGGAEEVARRRHGGRWCRRASQCCRLSHDSHITKRCERNKNITIKFFHAAWTQDADYSGVSPARNRPRVAP